MTEELNVGRSDPAYMAHAYLTKVPVPAITPFIEAHTGPGAVVLDPFAGSGMTGVAAAMLGRSARLFDISVLGQHIGRNYVNLVDAQLLEKQAGEVVRAAQRELGNVYAVKCLSCSRTGELAKTVWSVVIQCPACEQPVNYYESMKAVEWNKPKMVCPHCRSSISSRNERVSEIPVLDYVDCECRRTQVEQRPQQTSADLEIERLPYPRVEITPDRQMYKASALGKSGMTTIASFYSNRNLAVLTTLREQIRAVSDEAIRSKLLFAFTACLTRASKRYQWHPKRPLNAANANYYIAPVFYEWNVYNLFLRKVTAVVRSDEWIKSARHPYSTPDSPAPDVTYEISSAEAIPLPDQSIDYVFTDPPFGSNLFYADMALFQEAWLDGFSDVEKEAVVDRSRGSNRSATRYEELLTSALSECRRVLKPGGSISMVFGNSSGRMWALVQRAIRGAKLAIVPESLTILNKGQRSVKGLASGFEHIATLDLIITMRSSDATPPDLSHIPAGEIVREVRRLAEDSRGTTPSHLYLEILRAAIRKNWTVEELDLSVINNTLVEDGWTIESKSGRLCRKDESEQQVSESAPLADEATVEEAYADPLFE
ncbi:DNA methyltransferase [Nonomuraea sp. NEAU-A123]|uniref:DNA methyltransferase n=1 Tax=Nonomuraea sp. NEAU-A123 TaxID=2839649 RepID=UPI0035ABAD12